MIRDGWNGRRSLCVCPSREEIWATEVWRHRSKAPLVSTSPTINMKTVSQRVRETQARTGEELLLCGCGLGKRNDVSSVSSTLA